MFLGFKLRPKVTTALGTSVKGYWEKGGHKKSNGFSSILKLLASKHDRLACKLSWFLTVFPVENWKFLLLRVNLLSNLQWTLIMYPSSLTRSGKYSLVALQTMYFPLSSGLATNLMTDEVHSPCPLLSASESEVEAEATSNSRLSMNQRKTGIGREPWHRHSNVDSLPAEKALLRSPVIVTAKGGTEKQEKKWINFNNFFAHNIEFNLALSTRLEMALLSRF